MNSTITIRQDISSEQTALLLRFTGYERVRIWQTWVRVSELVDGQLIDEISYLGQHALQSGDTISVLENGSELDVEVLQIRYTDCKKLTNEEVQALGFESLDQYSKASQRPLPERAWYVAFQRLDASSYLAPPEARILDDVLTAQEAATLYDLSESTIRVNIHRGNIPARKSGGTWLLRRADVEERWHKSAR
jgi:excisionase family DNA binding protein